MKTQPTQALISKPARIATALAVAGLVACACVAAQHESEKAMLAAAAAFGPGPVYVTLPSVEIVGHRERAPADTAFAATGSPRTADEL